MKYAILVYETREEFAERDDPERDDRYWAAYKEYAGAQEALWLARIVAESMPRDAEALGLRALLTYIEARRASRRDVAGAYVPLERQDHQRWDLDRIRTAEEILMKARRMNSVGRYQIEAAIQSAHCARAFGPPVDPSTIAALYETLMHLAPSMGGAVSYAIARSRVAGAEAGLTILDRWAERGSAYQPYWAAKAELLRRKAQGVADDTLREAAREAYRNALRLTRDEATRSFLTDRMTAAGLTP
ncbi:MAG: hypothetical protein MI724_06195 [Spirochaetales bacterium]|nr:hypothetical protein [Spirochaetales bacterium]